MVSMHPTMYLFHGDLLEILVHNGAALIYLCPPKEIERAFNARSIEEATTGLEPVIRVLQTLAFPTWPRRHNNQADRK